LQANRATQPNIIHSQNGRELRSVNKSCRELLPNSAPVAQVSLLAAVSPTLRVGEDD
jgi:hypothetical protein